MSPEPHTDPSELMRAGVRDRVARLAEVTGREARRWSPPVLLAALAAGAFGPLLVSGVGGAAVVSAAVGALTAVGGNVLTDVIKAGVARLGEGGVAAQDDLEAALERQIRWVLEAGGEQAGELRREIAQVLSQTGVVRAVLQEAIESGDRDLQARLTVGMAELGQEFAEFGFVLADLGAQLRGICESVDRSSTQLQLSVGLQFRQATDSRLLLEQVAAIERRTRPSGDIGTGPGRDLRWRTVCPYRGLMTFTEADAEVFYGREIATAQLVSTLAHRLDGAGILVLTGPSGAGKSSLLRAGMMPAIGRGELSQPARHWTRHVLERPTRFPLSRLATLLAGMAGLDASTVLERLAARPDQAHLLGRQAVEAEARRRDLPDAIAAACRLVLVVDQFEEIFQQSADDERQTQAASEQTAFVTALHALASFPCGPDDGPAALVVIAVRGDFIDRCADHPPLASALRDSPFVLGPMGESDLRRTITGPADAAGLEVEPGLIDTILAELRAPQGGYGAGVLPLLSQAMLTTWEHREDDRLTSRGYGRTGGVTKAVATSAESAYAALNPAGQDAARQVFHHLTMVSAEGGLTRRPAVRSVLCVGPEGEEYGAAVEQVLESFARRRLLVIDEDSVQISHDVLLTAWPRLRGWLEADLAAYPLYRQLIDDADEWERSGRKAAYLYRGERLAAMQQTLPRMRADPARFPTLPHVPQDFLDAAARAETRTGLRRRMVVTLLTVLLAVAVAAAATAVRVQQDTSRQRDSAVSRRLAAQSELITADPALAALLAVAAWRISPTDEARASMLAVLRNPGRAVLTTHLSGVSDLIASAAFSPDGRMLAGTSGFAVWLWDVASRRPIMPLTGHTNRVNTVAFSPDGRILASGALDGTIQLWDVVSRRQTGIPLSGHTDRVLSMAFSPDGRTLLSGSEDFTMRLWNVATRKPIGAPLRGYTGSVDSVAFSPDGRNLAGSGGGKARLWDRTTRQPTGAFLPVNDYVWSVAFSPDGRTLATGEDGKVQLWHVATHKPIGAPLTGHADTVHALTFSPDGRSLASGSGDGTLRLWHIAAHRPAAIPLTARGDQVNTVAFSPDGRTLASGGDDDAVRLWNVATRKPSGIPLTGHINRVSSVAFGPDGRILASTDDEAVRLWDVASHRAIGSPLTGHTGAVYSVAFSPDGRTLASGRDDYTVWLWDVAAQRPVGVSFTGHYGVVHSVAFSPDGRILAGGGGDGVVRLWDVASHQPVGAPLTGHTGEVYSVAFSSDGRILATGGDDGVVRLWDVASHQPIGAPLTGHTGTVLSVDISPDGRTLASSSGDRTVRLWDVATRRPIGVPLTGHTAAVGAVAFSPDGQTLASGSDNLVWLWDVSIPARLDDAVCAIPARSLTRTEWAQYIPDMDFQTVCR
ncbi:AAA family ATPase [Nonomuraea typhae]|uniref:AAA family ATPase n=1 Tax=Nonomuraea typhae TaxID=2603600 RepID=A0ABW7YPH3_9ACTN